MMKTSENNHQNEYDQSGETASIFTFQLLESVQGVSDAVSETPQEEPPLPPYPNISDLSITGRSMNIFI